jgi:hypothetical protein
MNIDFSASFEFGDARALNLFLLDHATIHEQTATALTARFGGSYTTAGLLSPLVEGDWARLMQEKQGKPSLPLIDWLQIHYQIHNTTYQQLAGSATNAPDISIADFSKPGSFYDWMLTHQEMHDFEQLILGLS